MPVACVTILLRICVLYVKKLFSEIVLWTDFWLVQILGDIMCLRNSINNSQRYPFNLHKNIGNVYFVEHWHENHIKKLLESIFFSEKGLMGPVVNWKWYLWDEDGINYFYFSKFVGRDRG